MTLALPTVSAASSSNVCFDSRRYTSKGFAPSAKEQVPSTPVALFCTPSWTPQFRLPSPRFALQRASHHPRASSQLRGRAPRHRRASCAHASASRGGGESAEGAHSAASSPSQGNVTVVKEREGEQSSGRGTGAEAEAGSRGAFAEHCVEAMGQHMPLSPIPIRADWQVLEGSDGEGGKAFCRSVAVSAPKIRLMRSADISAGRTLQVLNLIAFPRPEYDLPYFCADLVTFPRGHLIVLDLNPLHQSEEHFNKYIAPIMPIANKYIEHLPWGGEFTSESLQFFSPALIWAKLPLDADVTAHVLPAFKEYLQAWLRMVEACEPTSDPAVMAHNMESQHRYICWRSVKVWVLLLACFMLAFVHRGLL
ncbi:unnamed protein product [Closterium sp. Yama58-4]|nr:unnamed protein product [Closterium sp. Yama58-4]